MSPPTKRRDPDTSCFWRETITHLVALFLLSSSQKSLLGRIERTFPGTKALRLKCVFAIRKNAMLPPPRTFCVQRKTTTTTVMQRVFKQFAFRDNIDLTVLLGRLTGYKKNPFCSDFRLPCSPVTVWQEQKRFYLL